MAKGFLFFILITWQSIVFSQNDSSQHLFADELIAMVENSLPTYSAATLLSELKEKLTTDPDLYNRAWAKINKLKETNKALALFRDLNVEFKTFEIEKEDLVGLGLKYDWNFDWRRFQESPLKRNGVSFQFQSNGNVAFRKELNPYDFLSSGFSFGGFQYSGGVANKTTNEIRDLLNELEFALANMTTTEEIESSVEWETFNENLVLTDQYYIGLDGAVELENTQDFRQKQWVAGIKLGLGAKGWAQHSTLAYFNLLDYPFALLRIITGTDKSFQPDGATIPVFMARIDYVKPVDDAFRKTLTGNENSFARLNMELGFRTLISEFKEHSIFFNADLRYYKEMNAPVIIRQVNLDKHTYFSASVSSTKGFFASFAAGKLPFDAGNDNVYELGFRYQFN